MADRADSSKPEETQVCGNQVANLSVFKKDKNVLKFMKKYRYQYHVTMLPDLAELVCSAYQEGYWNGVSQHRVTDLQPSDSEAKSGSSKAQDSSPTKPNKESSDG